MFGFQIAQVQVAKTGPGGAFEQFVYEQIRCLGVIERTEPSNCNTLKSTCHFQELARGNTQIVCCLYVFFVRFNFLDFEFA